MSNKSNLKKITKIIHPVVSKKMEIFLRKYKNRKFVLLDIPLFLENKLNKKNDVIIFIQSSKKDILKNLIKRKNYNKKLINNFKQIQLSLKIKKKIKYDNKE